MKKSGSGSTNSRPLFRRIALTLVTFLLILAAGGFLYENISEARDRRFNHFDGTRVNVEGRLMHIYCTGRGNPTVILDSGLGDSYLSWSKVQPEIAKFTRVCSYDRAGLGYSEPSSRPRTSKVIAEELHALLQNAGISSPYVMVGHSMGGYDVRMYTSMYPKEIAGMVLVDASHPDQENRFPQELRDMEGRWHREAQFITYTMPIGVPRLLGLCDADPRSRAAECNWHSSREQLEEMQSFSQSAAETAAIGSLSDLPLVVLSHDPDKPSSELPPDLARQVNVDWEKMQDELAHLSTRGTRTVVKNSFHYIQFDRPDVVTDAVHKVVEQAREAQNLPVIESRLTQTIQTCYAFCSA
jgi:pimeloyl-ACP methyl ester carboxylesterase